MQQPELAGAASKLKGVRPFVYLRSAHVSVKYKGPVHSRSGVRITYAADDVDGRVEFSGDIVNGNFSGLSRLKCRLIDENTGLYSNNIIEWYGQWDDGKRQGLHLGYEYVGGQGVFLVNKCIAVYSHGEYITEYVPPALSGSPAVTPDEQVLPEHLVASYESLKQSYLSVISTSSSTPSESSLSSGARSSDIAGGGAVDAPPSQVTKPNRTVRVAVVEANRSNPIYFDIKAHSRMKKIFDAYARKRDVPVTALSFYLNDVVIADDVTVHSLQVDDEDFQILAKLTPLTQSLEQLLATSTAAYLLHVVYDEGAKVRKGVELDSASIRVIPAGEYIEAFDTAKACDGAVTRYKLVDGWISEILRDSTLPIVHLLRHLPTKPRLYKVVNAEGAV